MNHERMIEAAKRLDTFFKVMQRVAVISMVVVICVMALLTVVSIVDPDAVIGEDFEKVDLGPVTIELAEEYAPDNRAVLTYAWIYVVLGIVSAAVIWYAFGQVRRILQPMKEGDPFRSEVCEAIRRIGYVTIALGVVQNIAGVIETYNAIRHFGLDRLVQGGQIRSVTANYTVDLSFLIVFSVFLLLSYIFHYGAELQRLSDETL